MTTKLQIIPATRICKTCQVAKPMTEYHKDRTATFGKKSRCKDCCGKINKERYPDKRRNRPDRILRDYGVTYEHVIRTLDRQHGLCANLACGKEISFEVLMGPDRAVIDHNHDTGKFRAILCMSCNLTLGKIEKDKAKIYGLLDYLNKYK